HSAISSGDGPERRRLVDALRRDDAARALLDEERNPHQLFDALTAQPGEVGEAMRAFRLIVGNGLPHGLDLTAPAVNGEPGLALAALRASVREAPRSTADGAGEAEIRARVPPQHRARFDELLEEARLVYRLRDERHLYGAMPILGIARRAILEAGRRLV